MDRLDIAFVGGGLAAATAAETYRKHGGGGTVGIFTQEPDRPVHRPPLSKEYLRGDAALNTVFVHEESFYGDHRISLRLDERVQRIDPGTRQLHLASGESVQWRTLVLATGARPRRLRVPGSELPGIYYLRSLRSAQHLQAASAGATSAVVIGAGFIGLEVAATLTGKGVACTVVELGPRMWPALVPAETAAAVQRALEARGVTFRFDTGVAALRGEGRVTAVDLSDGSSLPADLVVAGVGAVLNDELAGEAGLAIDRGVIVDQFFRTSHPDVYAIGDIANFPDSIGGHLHLEHWDNALAQGRALGATLAGQPEPFRHVAYFFSDLFDLSLNMVGYPAGWDRTEVHGDADLPSFTTVYYKEGKVRAALMVNDEADLERWTAAIREDAVAEARVAVPSA